MTATREEMQARRGRISRDLSTFSSVLCSELVSREKVSSEITWPCPDWQHDIVGFAVDVLGFPRENVWDRMAELLRTVQDNTSTALSGGRKVSKSTSLAIIAIWFFCSFPNAQVRIIAPNIKTVDDVVYREIKMILAGTYSENGELKIPIPCVIAEKAITGIKGKGFRSIYGFVPGTREAAAGRSGVAQLNIVDEASGVDDWIFDALKGNLAGGGFSKTVIASNPTKNEGRHFEAMQGKHGFVAVTISSLESPNVRARREVIPGLAKCEFIDEMLRDYGGEDAPDFLVHALGRHAIAGEGRAFSIDLLTTAQQRHYTADADGPLVIGLDPAGSNDHGDSWAMAARRKLRIIEIRTRKGVSTDIPEDGSPSDLEVWLMSFIDEHRLHPREKPQVIYDVAGDVGARALTVLRILEAKGLITSYPVRASDKPARKRQAFDYRAAELVDNFARFLRAGGGIPNDDQLYKQARAWEFKQSKVDVKKHSVDKKSVMKALGRSPDEFDACALAAWDVVLTEVAAAIPHQPPPPKASWEQERPRRDPFTQPLVARGGALDPFR